MKPPEAPAPPNPERSADAQGAQMLFQAVGCASLYQSVPVCASLCQSVPVCASLRCLRLKMNVNLP